MKKHTYIHTGKQTCIRTLLWFEARGERDAFFDWSA